MENELLTPTGSEKLIQMGSNENSPTIDNDLGSHLLTQNKNSNVKIWLADLTHTNSRIISNHMPYGIGCVAAFTEKYINIENPIQLFKYPEKLSAALENDGIPDIIGFSNFIWNSQLSLDYAKRIKKMSPKTIIIFGGPHYYLIPAEQEKFLRDNPQIDFYIPKEAEIGFANLITFLINSDLDKSKVKDNLQSVHSIGENGKVFLTDEAPRIKNLTSVPSPYTTGKLDEFFDGVLLPVIQTNRGCPFLCTFCDEGVTSLNKVNRRERWQIDAELEYIAKKLSRLPKDQRGDYLRIADSNFGMYKEDQITCETIAKCIKKYGWPTQIEVDTGKNDQKKVLKASEIVGGILSLNGSVQSLDEDVMKNMKRENISSEGLMQIALSAKKADTPTVSQLILCLPGETKKSHFNSISKIIDANFSHVTIFQLGIEPGAEMFSPSDKKKFGLKGRYRVMAECIGKYKLFNEKFTVGELEEICYETDSMTFDDYLSCRKMNLIISTFYNTFSIYWSSPTSSPFFDGVLKFLRSQKIAISRWMQLLHEEEEGELKEAFDAFEKASRDELWENKEEIKNFIHDSTVFEKYHNGSLGYNLQNSFRILLLTRYIKPLKDFTHKTLLKLLKENGKDSLENIAFVNDLLEYETSKIKNISKNLDETPEIILEYDILKFKDDEKAASVKDYKLSKPVTVKFVLDEMQKNTIKKTIETEVADKLKGIGNIIKVSSGSNEKTNDVLRTPQLQSYN